MLQRQALRTETWLNSLHHRPFRRLKRLDKLESEAPKKSKSVKQWAKKNRKKIKVALLVGVALYAGYHLFLKGKLKFGQGGQAPDPMPPAPAPAPQMETGGEIDSGDI